MHTNIEYEKTFQAIRSSLLGFGHEWLDSLRHASIKRFDALGIPNKSVENWKYTDMTKLQREAFSLSQAVTSEFDKQPAERTHLESAHVIHIASGQVVEETLQQLELPPGIEVMSFSAAIATGHHAFRENIGRVIEGDHPFAELSTAYMDNGVFIYIDEGTTIDKPIQIVLDNYFAHGELTIHPRILCVAEKNSRASLVEYNLSNDVNSLVNTVGEFVLKNSADISHYRIQANSESLTNINGIHVLQHAKSCFRSYAFDFGAMLCRTDLNFRLIEEGAHCEMHGLYLVDKNRHIDNHTRVEHLVAGTTSHEAYRGVLTDKSRAVFNGKVYVHQDAQKTDAAQSNHNLLLSDYAEVDTKPELEIYADDVKCSHGATVGQLDKDAMFYLASRGVDKKTAKALLIFAFANQVIDTVDNPQVQRLIRQLFVDSFVCQDIQKNDIKELFHVVN